MILALLLLISLFYIAAETIPMVSNFECRYCNSFSFTNIRQLQSHLRVRHFVAEEVNLKGMHPQSDMLLCKVCNIYLDPGLKFMESSHQFTTFHLRNMGSESMKSTQTSSQAWNIHKQAEDEYSCDDGFAFDHGGGEGTAEYCSSEGGTISNHGAAETLSPIRLQPPHIASMDWMPDRDDHVNTTGYEDVLSWVWNCPFNNDMFPYKEHDGGMSRAALDPDNYARYRAVHIFEQTDSDLGTRIEVSTCGFLKAFLGPCVFLTYRFFKS